MPQDPGGSARRRASSKLVAQLARQPLRRLGLVGALVLLAGSAAFGGLEPAAGAGTPRLAPLTVGTALESGPFGITVVSARSLDEVPRLLLRAEGNRWIAVVVEVTGRSESPQPASLLLDSVLAPGLTGVLGSDGQGAPEHALVTADSTLLSTVPPGLTFRVALLWEQSAAVAAPSTLDVVAVAHTYRASAIDGQLQWTDPAPLARGELEVVPAEPAVSTSAEPTGAGS